MQHTARRTVIRPPTGTATDPLEPETSSWITDKGVFVFNDGKLRQMKFCDILMWPYGMSYQMRQGSKEVKDCDIAFLVKSFKFS